MIKLDVINEATQHFVIRGDEPWRAEIEVVNGEVLCHVYRGDQTDLEQPCLGTFDGTCPPNCSWQNGELPHMTPVDSSNIREVGYDAANWRLFVRFTSGLYAYDHVPVNVWHLLMAAESKGKFMQTSIKSTYPYRKIGEAAAAVEK